MMSEIHSWNIQQCGNDCLRESLVTCMQCNVRLYELGCRNLKDLSKCDYKADLDWFRYFVDANVYVADKEINDIVIFKNADKHKLEIDTIMTTQEYSKEVLQSMCDSNNTTVYQHNTDIDQTSTKDNLSLQPSLSDYHTSDIVTETDLCVASFELLVEEDADIHTIQDELKTSLKMTGTKLASYRVMSKTQILVTIIQHHAL
jgi:hypothetical protein